MFKLSWLKGVDLDHFQTGQALIEIRISQTHI
jgi:hypothetical protein